MKTLLITFLLLSSITQASADPCRIRLFQHSAEGSTHLDKIIPGIQALVVKKVESELGVKINSEDVRIKSKLWRADGLNGGVDGSLRVNITINGTGLHTGRVGIYHVAERVYKYDKLGNLISNDCRLRSYSLGIELYNNHTGQPIADLDHLAIITPVKLN